MPEDLDYQPLQPDVDSGDPAAIGQGVDLARLREVPVELVVEVGRTVMTVGETLTLHPGSIVKLESLADEPVELLVNGTRIARGDVVVIEDSFGLRVTEVLSSETPSAASPALMQPGEGIALEAEEEAEPVEAEVVEEAAA
jgi:flagellar motor switch protein FliN/FliY